MMGTAIRWSVPTTRRFPGYMGCGANPLRTFRATTNVARSKARCARCAMRCERPAGRCRPTADRSSAIAAPGRTSTSFTRRACCSRTASWSRSTPNNGEEWLELYYERLHERDHNKGPNRLELLRRGALYLYPGSRISYPENPPFWISAAFAGGVARDARRGRHDVRAVMRRGSRRQCGSAMHYVGQYRWFDNDEPTAYRLDWRFLDEYWRPQHDDRRGARRRQYAAAALVPLQSEQGLRGADDARAALGRVDRRAFGDILGPREGSTTDRRGPPTLSVGPAVLLDVLYRCRSRNQAVRNGNGVAPSWQHWLWLQQASGVESPRPRTGTPIWSYRSNLLAVEADSTTGQLSNVSVRTFERLCRLFASRVALPI